ncbi:MAG: threonine/serine exporter family protein [Rikenellaceae bacterium]|nr:threonine/serine exporter family protein [Rikenellaceae bacterium]
MEEISANKFVKTILEIGSVLMESGAHCDRINRNLQRVADKAGFDLEIMLSYTAISVTATDKYNPLHAATALRRVKNHSAHFGIITEISILTWQYAEGAINFHRFVEKIESVSSPPRHPAWIIRLSVGLACACLCLLAGGDLIDGSFTFIASLTGLIVRQFLVKQNFNLMIAILCSSFITTIISGLDALTSIGRSPETAVATSVLFLIPGVPLINSIIDLVKGYYPTAISRGVFGGFILLCIALGMFIGMTLIGIDNF